MVNLTIDGQLISVSEKTPIWEAAASVGILIPKLCFLKDINDIGACRVCVVEVEGTEILASACNTLVEEGMVIHTNSEKAMIARRTNVELILSQHDFRCATCVRSGNCELQKIANDLDMYDMPFVHEYEENNWNYKYPLIREAAKCIKCMRCVQVCDKIQDMNIWDVNNHGRRLNVGVYEGKDIEDTPCSLCGQCITHCPVGALRERDDVDRLLAAIADKDKIIVAQIAPAVRSAWGESFGLPRDKATVNRLVAALKRSGVDYVFDTTFTADLTIMEEGSEFLERLSKKEDNDGPLFTSCCPGWVRFAKAEFPEYTANLSTAKSPQQMFGAVAKSYYAQLLQVEPSRIFCLSIMPCTAKKHECDLPSMRDAGTGQDVDAVLTTREVDRYIKMKHILPEILKEEEFDTPLGVGTGAGVIFGATGGVMEAALRSAYYLMTGANPDPDAFKSVRGLEGTKEYEFDIAGNKVRTAVVSGLANARKLMEAIQSGQAEFDFVEIMACPGGCSGGGGQPIKEGMEQADVRGEKLYDLDKNSALRFSHENPAVQKVYEDFFEKPLSHKAHELLHTNHSVWDMPKG